MLGGAVTGTHSLLDTEIKLATCNRCGAYVFAAQVSGLATAADPQPLDVDHYRAALIAGRWTYDVITQAGRPWKLRQRTAGVPTSGCDIVAAHACGAHGMDATSVTEVPQGPLQARVSASGHQDLSCASGAPQTGSQSLLPVSVATPHRSDARSRPMRCATCRRLIGEDEPRWAIEHDTIRWAVHDSCP